MDEIKKCVAILLMSGNGSRFQARLPKQFCHLSGKPLYQYAFKELRACKALSPIVLVCHPDYLQEVKAFVGDEAIVIPGGETRQESSYLGLLACQGAEYVLIHDAVRPFVSKRIVQDNLEKVQVAGAVDTCIPSHDTLVQTDGHHLLEKIPDRTRLLRGQTPQTFRYSLILDAHQKARALGITNAFDDCSLVLRLGHPVTVVAGSDENIKVTTAMDLDLAELVLRRQKIVGLDANSQLTGKRYLVVGGNGGIGRMICKKLHDAGAFAYPLSRSTSPYSANISNEGELKDVFSKISQPFDGLINSAGYLKAGFVRTADAEEIRRQWEVNFLGVVFACKHVPLVPGGHILNIASSSYVRGRGGCAIYAASKAAVVNFTQALSEEHPEWSVNALVPQRTKTRLRIENFPGEAPDLLLDPEEVAKAVLAILRTEGMTGQVIEVKK